MFRHGAVYSARASPNRASWKTNRTDTGNKACKNAAYSSPHGTKPRADWA